MLAKRSLTTGRKQCVEEDKGAFTAFNNKLLINSYSRGSPFLMEDTP